MTKRLIPDIETITNQVLIDTRSTGLAHSIIKILRGEVLLERDYKKLLDVLYEAKEK